MKKRAWTLALALLFIVVLGIAFAHWRSVAGKFSRNQSSDKEPASLQFITLAKPVTRDFRLRVPWIGEVRGQSSIKLTATTSGQVKAIEAKDEAPIKAGSAVMRLGGVQIESKGAELKAAIDSLEAQLPLATQRVERLEQSVKEQLSTRDELATAQEEQMKLEAQLRDARLALDSFEKQVEIEAPVSGIFTGRKVSAGQAVTAGDVVAEIVDPNHLRVTASLFPPDGVKLEGKQANVRLSSREISATVTRVLPEVSETGATVVWIEGADLDSHLRSGETVSGDLIVETHPSALAVPESAVVYGPDERPYIFVQGNNAYERRQIEVGLTEDGFVEVLSGLAQDEPVVIKGAYEIFYQNFNRQFKVED
jgi:RND family efflux transporter MFP subunit